MESEHRAASAPRGRAVPTASNRRADRRYERCPECKEIVRAEKLTRHRDKVHGRSFAGPARPLPLVEFEKDYSDFNPLLDQTVDTEDRCSAITRSGTRCTRSIAVQLGPHRFCSQHA